MKNLLLAFALLLSIGGNAQQLTLVKTGFFVDDNSNGSAEPGETIIWNFEVINNSSEVITNIIVGDPLVTVIGNPIVLNPGSSDTSSFTATWAITTEDINAGFFVNQAFVEGTLPNGDVITDLSDDNSHFENDPTIVLFPFPGPTEDALVFLADKEDVAASIANPISILTQDAIDRKLLHNTAIDERDVPVNEAYITQLKNNVGLEVLSKSKWMNAVYVRGSQANIENLTNLAFVDSVEYMDKSLNFWGGSNPVPDKFAMESASSRIEYDYGAANNQTVMLGVDFLHTEDFTGDGMVIAVLDSGFPNFVNNPAFSHIVSEGRLLGTYDFAERQTNVDGTGTHGSSTTSDIGAIVAGNPDPEDNFVGTAPDASFYLFRTEYAPTENPVEEAWWVEALERADSLGVDVVNTSLGYQDYDNPAYDHSYEDLDGQTTIAARGANLAWEKGMLLVTSAGNDGQNFTYVATPADAPGVLTVGAVDSNGDYADFSSIGPTVDGRIKPDVMAKGASAAVVDPNGNVTTSSGTSFSSPIMAGAVAALWQSRPEVPNFRVMNVVREAADLFEGPTNEMGYGIPNFEMAWWLLQNLGGEDEQLENQFAIYPNPAQDIVNISFPKKVENATVVLYDIFGKRISEKSVSAVDNTMVLSSLAPGMYVLKISSEEKTNSFKIIKK